MRNLIVALAVCGAFGLTAGVTRADDEAYSINVTFINRTSWNVPFFLSGGDGLQARLNPGRRQSYEVSVDPGTEPYVRIYQFGGRYLDFSLQDGGRYAFRVNSRDWIENCYDN